MNIDKTLLDNLLAEAAVNPRLRQNFDLRTTPADGSQRMLNAMLPGTVVPIHRHNKSTEVLVLLRGRMEQIFYEERPADATGADGSLASGSDGALASGSDGALRETRRVLLSADGPVMGQSIPVGQWHSVNVLEPTVILECKDGPFEPLAPEDMVSPIV